MAAPTALRQRVAVVTGGTGDLGLAIAKCLADRGFAVAVLHTIGHPDMDRWLADREAEGYRFLAVGADVADHASCQRAVDEVRAKLGPVSVLVNNAGIARDAPLRKMHLADWQAVIRTNLDSMFNMTKPVVEDMVAAGWGRIVNIASVNGQTGAYGQTNYSASKAGILGFTRSLALELARHGITVNAISPGYLESRMVAKVSEPILREKILPRVPLGRLGQVKEVADLVGWIVSDPAGYSTGANFPLNGGQFMG